MVWVQVMHDFNPVQLVFNPVQLVFPLWKPVPKNLTGYMQLCSDNRRQTKRIAIAFKALVECDLGAARAARRDSFAHYLAM
jgi:hypothetical protein